MGKPPLGRAAFCLFLSQFFLFSSFNTFSLVFVCNLGFKHRTRPKNVFFHAKLFRKAFSLLFHSCLNSRLLKIEKFLKPQRGQVHTQPSQCSRSINGWLQVCQSPHYIPIESIIIYCRLVALSSLATLHSRRNSVSFWTSDLRGAKKLQKSKNHVAGHQK